MNVDYMDVFGNEFTRGQIATHPGSFRRFKIVMPEDMRDPAYNDAWKRTISFMDMIGRDGVDILFDFRELVGKESGWYIVPAHQLNYVLVRARQNNLELKLDSI